MKKPNPKNSLPEWCFAYDPSDEDGMVIKILRGDRGYCQTNLTGGKAKAISLNAEYDISPAQMEAMIVGSIWGWTVPGANPAIYSAKTGQIIVKKAKAEIKARRERAETRIKNGIRA
jgi:hypothetical protein